MKVRIKLAQLDAVESGAIARPAGYAADLRAVGVVDGEHLLVEEVLWSRIRHKYGLTPMRGVGDAVARVAQPIAKVIDKIAKTNIADCGGCQKRRELLNPKETV